jgi:uncharacterized membrane protein YoaK (UPF0700 family)
MDRFDRQRQGLAIAIAFLAGLVDTLGFLSGDRYFVSFMSGNTTRLAVDLATHPGRAIMPALLIAGFVAGVAGGRIVALRACTRRKVMLLGLVTLLLASAAAAHGAGAAGLSLAAMVLAMGAVNNSFQRDGTVAVGLTYMTGALVRLGQGIGGALIGVRQPGWGAYMLLWAGLLGGAVTGALLFTRLGGPALWLAALLAATLALASSRIAPRLAG